jgi:hypothetical protein
MSVRNLVVLDSSPPSAQPDFAITPPQIYKTEKTPPPSRFYDGQVIPNSSSSDLPSPSDFWRVTADRRLQAGSPAEKVLQIAVSDFRNVSGLVKDRGLSASREVEQAKGHGTKPTVKKGPKPRQPKPVTNADKILCYAGHNEAVRTEVKAAPKKRAVKAKVDAGAEAKKPRKRPTKSKVDKANNMISAAQVGCATSALAETKKRKGKTDEALVSKEFVERAAQVCTKGDVPESPKSKRKIGTVSTHFETGSNHEMPVAEIESFDSPIQLNIPIAAKRRRDWTPVKDTTTDERPGASSDIHSLSVSPTVTTSVTAKTSFSSLQDFAYVQKAHSLSPERMLTSNVASNKRRKIEVYISDPLHSCSDTN